jgi:spore coat protein U-like protein
MTNRFARRVEIASIVALALAGSTVGARAASTQTTLVATVTIVSSCQISNSVPLAFPSIPGAGKAIQSLGNGSITYACKGVSPVLSASDSSDFTDTFVLHQGGNTIPFLMCAYNMDGACIVLKNGNASKVPVNDSGTELIYGLIRRGATQTFPIGNYSDDVVVTLSF